MKIFSNFQNLLNEILESYVNLSKIYKYGNYNETFNLLENLNEIETKIKKTIGSSSTSKSLLLYHFGRIIGYSINVAEITIDQIAFNQLFEKDDNINQE